MKYVKRLFPYILILTIVIGVFAPFHVVRAVGLIDPIDALKFLPSIGNVATIAELTPSLLSTIFNVSFKAVMAVLTFLVFIIMKLAGFILGLAGLILNTVIMKTVVQMSDGINNMNGINVAWKITRDLMNIGFIFMLVHQGIKLIIGKETRDNIQNFIFMIVLASLLVNFSLFFTKVIIDSSNIVTIGIYNAIVVNPNAKTGLSNSLMQSMGLQSFWAQTKLPTSVDISGRNSDDYSHFVANLLSVVLFLITAFVFLAVSAMFVVRYIVLILLLTLSPIAYMGMAIPGIQSHAKKWWDTLLGQIIFAPLFMGMMLITLTLIAGNLTGPTNSVIDLGEATSFTDIDVTVKVIFDFALIIGFTIASLVIAKKYSSQGHEYVGKMSNWATGKVTEYGGKAVFGLGGAAGRRTIGAGASRLAQSQRFQNFAANSWVGEQALKATRRTADSSFDVRATRAGAGLTAAVGGLGTAQSGGYNRTLADKTTSKQKFADSLTGNTAKKTYAARIAGGPLTQGGSRSSGNSVFGILGRHNRTVASKILFTQIEKLKTDLSNGNTELARYQNVIAAGGTLNPNQLSRYTILNGTGNGSLTNMQTSIDTLQKQIDDLGISNPGVASGGRILTQAQQNDNAADILAGLPPRHGKATRADEQNY